MTISGYGTISEQLFQRLGQIEPSQDGDILYRPCLVALADGSLVDRVYVMDFDRYIRHWGVRPEHDRGKSAIPIESVTAITASPSRMPARFANELYRAGESGMGYCVFTVTFNDRRRVKYLSGNAVDFVSFPEGLKPDDVVGVEPHTHPRDDAISSPGYSWCLYDGVGGAA